MHTVVFQVLDNVERQKNQAPATLAATWGQGWLVTSEVNLTRYAPNPFQAVDAVGQYRPTRGAAIDRAVTIAASTTALKCLHDYLSGSIIGVPHR